MEICVLLEVMEVSVQKSVAVRMALALLWMVHVIAQWGTQGYTVTSHALQAQRVRTVPSTVTVQYMEPVIHSLGYVSEYFIKCESTGAISNCSGCRNGTYRVGLMSHLWQVKA